MIRPSSPASPRLALAGMGFVADFSHSAAWLARRADVRRDRVTRT